MRKVIKYGIAVVAVLLVVIQFFQPERTNPPVNPASTFEAVAKPGPGLAGVVNRACRDCHSNETTWPWYSKIAPVSWLVADDVKEARAHLNFSEWGYYSPEMSRLKLKEACTEVKGGDMPLWIYRLVHAQARLTDADVQAICSAGTAP